MSEIYRNSTGMAVVFDIPTATLTKVEFKRGEEVVDTAYSSPAQIPYAITHYDGEFEVVWTYSVGGTEYTLREANQVVTPLFTTDELIAFNDQFKDISDGKAKELERLCRNIIESFTGQSFGFQKGIIKLSGSGTSVLYTDKKIVEINSVSVGGAPYGYLPYTYRPIKNGFGIEQQYMGENSTVFTSVAPINDPDYTPYAVFKKNTPYFVDGVFGWVSPPADIKQAALLLAEEFSCREATWRDRYLRAVTAADWRFDFSPGAFTGTGSVAVDQILSKYVVNSMAII